MGDNVAQDGKKYYCTWYTVVIQICIVTHTHLGGISFHSPKRETCKLSSQCDALMFPDCKCDTNYSKRRRMCWVKWETWRDSWSVVNETVMLQRLENKPSQTPSRHRHLRVSCVLLNIPRSRSTVWSGFWLVCGLRRQNCGAVTVDPVFLLKSFLTIWALHLRGFSGILMSAGPVYLIALQFQQPEPELWSCGAAPSLTPPSVPLCLFASLQKWFELRNALWRQSEGLPAKLGSVLDWEEPAGPCFSWTDSPMYPPPSPLHLHLSSLFLYLWSCCDCAECEGVLCVLANITSVFTE